MCCTELDPGGAGISSNRPARLRTDRLGSTKVPTSKGTTISVSHWFDGFGQTHRFQLLSPTRVVYNSRYSTDSLVAYVRRTGNIPNTFTFAQRRDPCQSLWRMFLTSFVPMTSELEGKVDGVNISVTVSRDVPGLPATAKDGKRSLYTGTDASVLQGLDPDTLEPVGIASQSSLHPELKGQMSSAHAHVDPETGDVFNYNLEISWAVTYRVFRTSRATGKTEILGTITDAPPAYIHSFFLTRNFVVLCVYSAHFGMGGIRILYHRNMLDALDDVSADRMARWYVVDRRNGRGVVRKYTSDAFFAFHSANAWEEGGGIVAEVPAYENIDIIKKFYLHNLKGETEEARKWATKGRSKFSRFWLPGVEGGAGGEGKAQLVWAREEDMSMELPKINPQFSTRPTRCVTPFPHLLFATDSLPKLHIRPNQPSQIDVAGCDNQARQFLGAARAVGRTRTHPRRSHLRPEPREHGGGRRSADQRRSERENGVELPPRPRCQNADRSSAR